jgi:DNA-binding response OmpR family regulator
MSWRDPLLLIVDDEPDVVEYLAGELELAGWHAGRAYNGRDSQFLNTDRLD